MADPADARSRAKESLAVCPRTPRGNVLIHEDDLRALLAAGPEAKAPPSAAVREAEEAIARRLFGSREHVALWDAINEFREAPNLIAREHAVVRVEDGLRAVILAALASPPAAPAQDAVREAAERLREHVHFEDGEDGEPVAFLGSGFEEAFLTLLDALDAAKGGE